MQDDQIGAKAREVCAGARNDLEKCYELFQYVRAGGTGGILQRESMENPQGPEETFWNKKADCDERVYLFNRMAGAAGIRARIAIGERMGNGEKVRHAAAAVLLPLRDDNFAPNMAFEKDAAYRRYALSRLGMPDSPGLHLYLIDPENRVFSLQEKFEIFWDMTPAEYLNRGAGRAKLQDFAGALSDFRAAQALCAGSAIYGSLAGTLKLYIVQCEQAIEAQKRPVAH